MGGGRAHRGLFAARGASFRRVGRINASSVKGGNTPSAPRHSYVAHGRHGRAKLEPIGLHECRHTYAAFMIAAGVNAKRSPSRFERALPLTVCFAEGEEKTSSSPVAVETPSALRLRHGAQSSPGKRRRAVAFRTADSVLSEMPVAGGPV